jgi:hypothetical protein
MARSFVAVVVTDATSGERICDAEVRVQVAELDYRAEPTPAEGKCTCAGRERFRDRGVSIAVRNGGGHQEVQVSDLGPGIAAEDRRRFERFVRGQERHGEQVRGSGIGIALVRQKRRNARRRCVGSETAPRAATFSWEPTSGGPLWQRT